MKKSYTLNRIRTILKNNCFRQWSDVTMEDVAEKILEMIEDEVKMKPPVAKFDAITLQTTYTWEPESDG